jgi:nitrite reductase/ring-hydroxylating ferredoxin subunit
LPRDFVRALGAAELAPGGMKAVTIEGREIVVASSGGRFFSIERRCGHMNAPLELGTLDGTIVTCPMHCAQFDLATGAALCGPVPVDLGKEPAPKRLAKFLGDIGTIMQHVRTESIAVFETEVVAGQVLVRVDTAAASAASK